jgi:peptidoglycan/LPS O-acetylase OafA/YrhL
VSEAAMLKVFLNGATVMGSLACALFFLRFWRQSRDRLFAFFSLAFVALTGNWLLLTLFNASDETRHYLYLLRLAAFLLIIYGIWDKNRKG